MPGHVCVHIALVPLPRPGRTERAHPDPLTPRRGLHLLQPLLCRLHHSHIGVAPAWGSPGSRGQQAKAVGCAACWPRRHLRVGRRPGPRFCGPPSRRHVHALPGPPAGGGHAGGAQRSVACSAEANTREVAAWKPGEHGREPLELHAGAPRLAAPRRVDLHLCLHYDERVHDRPYSPRHGSALAGRRLPPHRSAKGRAAEGGLRLHGGRHYGGAGRRASIA
mmetsp:Transcript_70/g.196  ORF Transcript_70/g.196 Transcript_70/m.196 type:complete len:221 (-) Transcript_70:459-1121(-)